MYANNKLFTYYITNILLADPVFDVFVMMSRNVVNLNKTSLLKIDEKLRSNMLFTFIINGQFQCSACDDDITACTRIYVNPILKASSGS